MYGLACSVVPVAKQRVWDAQDTWLSQSVDEGTASVPGPHCLPFQVIVFGLAGVAMQKVVLVHETAVPPSVPAVLPLTVRQLDPFQTADPKSPPTAMQKLRVVQLTLCTTPYPSPPE
jgi:hypothetical protein